MDMIDKGKRCGEHEEGQEVHVHALHYAGRG
jgi:hypothetical protein